MKKIIEISDFSFSFGKKKILERIDFDVFDNENVAIIGPSGCGKTTFLRVISGLTDSVEKEKIHVEEKNMGFVFQEDRLIPWATVRQNLLFIGAQEHEISDTLSLVGLSGCEDYMPNDLSGGMKQRVNIARALAKKPKIIFFDEPFQSLDFEIKIQLLQDVYRLSKNPGFACIMVTHSIREALSFADRIYFFSKNPASIMGVEKIEISEKHRNLFDPFLINEELKIVKKLGTGFFY